MIDLLYRCIQLIHLPFLNRPARDPVYDNVSQCIHTIQTQTKYKTPYYYTTLNLICIYWILLLIKIDRSVMVEHGSIR